MVSIWSRQDVSHQLPQHQPQPQPQPQQQQSASQWQLLQANQATFWASAEDSFAREAGLRRSLFQLDTMRLHQLMTGTSTEAQRGKIHFELLRLLQQLHSIRAEEEQFYAYVLGRFVV